MKGWEMPAGRYGRIEYWNVACLPARQGMMGRIR
jgi:hypothetical protein